MLRHGLGAGGRGVTTDWRDASDSSGDPYSANPRCWTGRKIMGISAGLNYKL